MSGSLERACRLDAFAWLDKPTYVWYSLWSCDGSQERLACSGTSNISPIEAGFMSRVHRSDYNPDHVSPPGETVQEALEIAGISHGDLAHRLGVPTLAIHLIVEGVAPITPEIALQLESVLNVPAKFWLSREAKYRGVANGQRHQPGP